ncbi:hypothetical protein ANCCAN_10193 [Ancylostoma caninum]|uniref:Sodium:sulfate symporter transmembrane region n=1 Tax=Ancylostoma caninum TaxID=29170 RepID=A0A368GHE8_ANCCA|nr:hypothetical protein ANCCAN_10193 [Ancylostoma caninum]
MDRRTPPSSVRSSFWRPSGDYFSLRSLPLPQHLLKGKLFASDRGMVLSQQVKWAWIAGAPVLFSPLLYFGMPSRCIYCILLISSFWIAEVVPIGITSLLPVFLFPVLGISSAKEICLVYFKDSIVLFICTLSMALAVEETNLHRRIALKLLCKVGTRKQTMLLGFMAITALV